MKFALITGVSKGLGESVAQFLLESQINVIGISRTENEGLVKLAAENNAIYKHYACDLGDQSQVEKMLSDVITKLEGYDLTHIYVINNAATLDPINTAHNIRYDELSTHYAVNVISPMVILNSFIDHYKTRDETVIGVNVTSGAANRPVYGWSAYCSSKASINAYTSTIALEIEQLDVAHKVIGFNPGVMDTTMQEKIRSTDKESFLDVDLFISYKQNQLLKDTDVVAGVLVDVLTDDVNIQNGKTYDVNDYV